MKLSLQWQVAVHWLQWPISGTCKLTSPALVKVPVVAFHARHNAAGPVSPRIESYKMNYLKNLSWIDVNQSRRCVDSLPVSAHFWLVCTLSENFFRSWPHFDWLCNADVNAGKLLINETENIWGAPIASPMLGAAKVQKIKAQTSTFKWFLLLLIFNLNAEHLLVIVIAAAILILNRLIWYLVASKSVSRL